MANKGGDDLSAKVIIDITKRIEQDVKKLVKEDAIKWDPHALAELDNDDISTEEVKAAIDSIELIELFWTHGYHSPKCLLYLNIPGKPHTHIVVMLSDTHVYIKTGYIASDASKFKPDGKTRIKNFEK